ncbi:hypothetical protein CEXT_275741 [Caerostris extrusa]|uniref:LAGLIDADG homing endonuclease n=1 Tax=Caerostris extrusa TaxID=172846 RepID=A0AAV4S3Z9_CAEEX|nr:hypothetical protein CEXT_275741 [Caerostris extrusa]
MTVPGIDLKKADIPTAQLKSETFTMITERYPSEEWIHVYTDGSLRRLFLFLTEFDDSDNGKLFQNFVGDGIKSRCRFNFRVLDEDGNIRRRSRRNNIIGVVLIKIIDGLHHRVFKDRIRNWVKLKSLFEILCNEFSFIQDFNCSRNGTVEVRNFSFRAFEVFSEILE